MGIEAATYLDELDPSLPDGGDDRNTADDHLRLIKGVLQNTFPQITGEVTADEGELSILTGVTAAAAELNLLAGAVKTQLTDDKAVIAASGPSVYFGDGYLTGLEASKLFPGWYSGIGPAVGYWDVDGGVTLRSADGLTEYLVVNSSGDVAAAGGITQHALYSTSGAAAEYEFTGLSADSTYEFYLDFVKPVADGDLFVQVGDGTGYDATSGDYEWAALAVVMNTTSSPGTNNRYDSGIADKWRIVNGVDSAAGLMRDGVSGKLTLYTGNVTQGARFTFQGVMTATGNYIYAWMSSGAYKDSGAAKSCIKIKFFYGSGNIASGSIKLARELL